MHPRVTPEMTDRIGQGENQLASAENVNALNLTTTE
jgi:hypothetical protein